MQLVKVTGSLLLADISGFTEISEKLGKIGKRGTEELTKILNNYFDTMLQIIRNYNGEILRLAGDAILAKFTSDKEWVSKCAKEMFKGLLDFKEINTSVGKFGLEMRIITQTGTWNEFFIGDKRHKELFLSSKLIKELAQVEEKAHAGEIINLGSALRISSRRVSLQNKTFTHLEQFPNEHRAIAPLFIEFTGYNEENPDIPVLQKFFCKILDIIQKWRGHLQLVDNICPQGSKILVLFGAPVAYGEDILNAVKSIYELPSSIENIKIRAGLASGYAYTGVIGNEWYREYTAIGDVVNTASRLAETVEYGEFVVSEDVYRFTRQYVDYKGLEPVYVKGKKEPLRRYIPLRITEREIHKFEFVGREREFLKILSQVEEGNKLIVITGEPGIGKSRLLYELGRKLTELGYTVLHSKGNELQPAYYVFAMMMKDEFKIQDDEPVSIKKSKLEAGIRNLIQLQGIDSFKEDKLYRRLSFIGKMLFGLDYPDSAYEKLSPELRKENLFDAIRYYIEYHTEPICIILDDLHWAKTEDLEAIKYLTRVLLLLSDKKISFIVSKRPQLRKLPLDEDVEKKCLFEIELTPLGQRALNRLIRDILKNKPLEPELDKFVRERTQGNPFYLEQILMYLIEKEFIKEEKTQWIRTKKYKEEAIPENVFLVVMARVDRLHELARKGLRIGSAIGLVFRESIVNGVAKSDLHNALMETVEEKLTNVTRFEKELEYMFSHAIIRDVVYESILHEERKRLHKPVSYTHLTLPTKA